ncbi:NAD(P)H-binding protein [Streptomyces sp. NBC_00882]|uniref:NAD(P)-dependent oxidoreductase n=1 Tax=Streptomyces TaxID=1883 RepID=UPI003867A0D0|nr:NAD(P)H-binding protein [Streptomyces sp. NBC_00882]WSZ55106.1 NAD(P)H-binding protein [Streptomyces canus]
MSRIVVFGGGGKAGRLIAQEARQRGHEVVSVVRDPAKYGDLSADGTTVVGGDVTDGEQVAEIVAGADVVVNAIAPAGDTVPRDAFAGAADALVAGLTKNGTGRLLSIGLAATLDVAPGTRLMDTPEFPADYRPFADGHAAALEFLASADAAVDWVVLVPPLEFQPEGERTGSYRIGDTGLLTDADGNSRISYADFAIAVLDEAEQNRHHRATLAVAY